MANYAKQVPKDVSGNALTGYPPAIKALTAYTSANAVNSSVISLNPNTTVIEVTASGGTGVVIRWVPLTETASVSPFASVVASGLGANYDHYVPAAWQRQFVVPRETMGQNAGGQIGSVNGLYQRLAWINAGSSASSILANEY